MILTNMTWHDMLLVSSECLILLAEDLLNHCSISKQPLYAQPLYAYQSRIIHSASILANEKTMNSSSLESILL